MVVLMHEGQGHTDNLAHCCAVKDSLCSKGMLVQGRWLLLC